MADVAICEQAPKVLGRLLGCLLAPKPTKGKTKQQPAPSKTDEGDAAPGAAQGAGEA